jgi:integrase/recombinase XerD
MKQMPGATRTGHNGVVSREEWALDAGVPLRDVQEAASYADPRTTMRYDRGRQSLDRHATYIVATFVAGASR